MPGEIPTLPAPLEAAGDRLAAAGHAAFLTGPGLRDRLQGAAAAEQELVSDAPIAALLSLFPAAVVTAPRGERLTLATPAGPLDLRSWAHAGGLPSYLAQSDFRIHAIALDLRTRHLVDPFDGRLDLASGRLRTPLAAKEVLAADPVRAVRAARLVAELALRPDPELEAAMVETASRLAGAVGRRLRIELETLLLADGAAEGLSLLLRTRVLSELIPGVRSDAPAVVGRLPRDVELRLAALLRGAGARAVLRRLRAPRERADRIERLLQRHPVDQGPASARELRARRLARRPETERRALLALRAAELEAQPGDAAARRRFERLREGLERARRIEARERIRAELALDGRAVMEVLGCGPGALVGRALGHLAEQVAEDPARNDPETLRQLLREWQRRAGGAGRGRHG